MNSNSIINVSNGSDFAALRQGGGVYVDKTELLHRLITDPQGGLYVVSRPPRFGKSLMLSTLKCIFQGKKELFKGTCIYDQTDYDWPVVKVLHFDMSEPKWVNLKQFNDALNDYVRDVLQCAGYTQYNEDVGPSRNFSAALSVLSEDGAKPVAVLIDGYDAPIGQALSKPKLADSIRKKLSSFYLKLKSKSSCIRFLMMTGVSKYTQLSIFSCLNNLTDLCRYDDFATLFGYTEQELDDNFAEQMKTHANVMGLTEADYRAELKRWYGGYCFGEEVEAVYNPMAVNEVLSAQASAFRPTWTAEDRPAELLPFVKSAVKDGTDYLNSMVWVYPEELGRCGTWSEQQKPDDMLYQFGYLSIDRYDDGERQFVLGIPNEEMRLDLEAMVRSLSL